MLMMLETSLFESHLLLPGKKKRSEHMKAGEGKITTKPIPQFKQWDRKI